MNPQDSIDFSREAIKTCMMVGGPILLASLLIGLAVGVIQAMTQVQDQTVSFVPKILLLLLMIGVSLPWLTQRMVDFSTESFSTPMTHWNNAQPIAEPGPASQDPTLHQDSTPQPTRQYTPPVSKLPFNTASIQSPQSNQRASIPASKASFAPLDPTKPLTIGTEENVLDPVEPRTTSPFILPHYRISKAPKTDIEG